MRMDNNKSPLNQLLHLWKVEAGISDNIAAWVKRPAVPAQTAPFPETIPDSITARLQQIGVTSLYLHQHAAYLAARRRRNVVVSTGTASGKSLCYQLPILETLLEDSQATALMLFPTKALAVDQEKQLLQIIPPGADLPLGVYDGDTPSYARPAIRKNARVLITNPDMLHNAILPHHANWARFFSNLRFIVIDEVHIYRGVFGSHVSNLLRRLKRICRFHQSQPVFLLTSATISNPDEHARNLVEEEFALFDQSGAPAGERNFLIYNPPLVNEELGIRRSALAEATRLCADLMAYQIQSLLFAQTRRAVELGVRYLRENNPELAAVIHAYRSGYLPKDRRQIENDLKTGRSRAVVATNALELGVDIGSMDAVVILGYPGSIASTRQQSGRAGRKLSPSVSILVASSNPLDQYLVRRPEFIIERSTERALINPNNPLILLQHLRCAVFELPFGSGDSFGSLPWSEIEPYLSALQQMREVHAAKKRYFWAADQYPAQNISLRSGSPSTILLQTETEGKTRIIGEVDEISAAWMVHPQAVYLHQADTYLVEALDFEEKIARLRPIDCDYFTETLSEIDITKVSDWDSQRIPAGEINLGEIMVTSRVVAFRKIRWYTNEHLGAEDLDMPAHTLQTVAYWLTIDDQAVKILSQLNLWSGAPINYGPNWEDQRLAARQRDGFTCQHCGKRETYQEHHVHHKTPFRRFESFQQANRLENLITLCPSCHRLAEGMVKMRSGLAGLRHALSQLAPLFVMCDPNDLGSHVDYQLPMNAGKPTVILYDRIPAGIGLCDAIYKMHTPLVSGALEMVENCPCQDGCPSCVGAAGENGLGGKEETLALLKLLNGKPVQV